MYHYDTEKNILRVYHYQDYPLDFNILDDQKESYQRYLSKGIYADMQFLVDCLNRQFKRDDIRANVTVGSLYASTYKKEVKRQGTKYYPVNVEFTSNGIVLGKAEVFRIPYMDTECKLNVNGQRKVILIEQKASNDISYNETKKQLTIQCKGISTNFSWTKSGPKIVIPSRDDSAPRNEKLSDVCRSLLNKEGRDNSCWNDLTNPILLDVLGDYTLYNDTLQSLYVEKTGVFERLHTDGAALGYSRERLNELLSIDSALGEVLSRPLLNYPAGTHITEDVLKDLKRNKVNCVQIYSKPQVHGKYLSEVIIYPYIPKGTRNCKILREFLPEEAMNDVISQDYHFDETGALYLFQGKVLTEDDVELLFNMGETQVRCSGSKTGTPVTYTFEKEILGNHSYRKSDIDSSIVPGTVDDDWLYDYEDESNYEYLTGYDMLGLISLFARIITTGVNPLMNKDKSYLKKVELVEDVFSVYFRRVCRPFLRKMRRKLASFVAGNNIEANPFIGLYNEWRKALIKGRVLVNADTVNVVAELSQVNHVTTIVQNKHSIDDMQRRLAIPYFGRICSYETPAGKSLGIVNSKAVGAKVINNLICCPLRRVLKDGNILMLSNKVEYLNVVECQKYRIGDFHYLNFKSDGVHFENGPVIAIVPDPQSASNGVMYASIEASHLDYVTCHSAQTLSPTACLMPFLECNDANRINFGLGMYKQSIHLLRTEQPRVMTFMHQDIFNYPNSFIVRAEKSGKIVAIERGQLVVLYDDAEDATDETIIPVQETRITNSSVLFSNYRKTVGEHFQKGDILVDTSVLREGIYSPARSELVAYVITPFNHEDGIDIAENLRDDYISIHSACVEHKIKSHLTKTKSVDSSNMYKYISPGSTIANIRVSDSRALDGDATVSITSDTQKGILYNIETINEDNGTTYKAHILSFNRQTQGDKMAGLHGNKGVTTHVTPTSKAFQLANGMNIKLMLNPLGVPSRMNLGQGMEAPAGLIATVLDTHIQSDPFNGANKKDLKDLMCFAYELANAPNVENDRRVFDAVARQYSDLPVEFVEHCWEVIDNIIDWRGTFDRNGDAYLWDPQSMTWLEFPVTIGCSTILKLMQEADEKEHGRAGPLEEPYNALNRQPPKGSRKKGGQREGEMELVNLVEHGVRQYLYEVENGLSDNLGDRVNAHLKALNHSERVDSEFCTSRAYEALVYYLEALGVKFDVSEDYECKDLDLEYANNSYAYNIKRVIRYMDEEDDTVDVVNTIIDAIFKQYT